MLTRKTTVEMLNEDLEHYLDERSNLDLTEEERGDIEEAIRDLNVQIDQLRKGDS